MKITESNWERKVPAITLCEEMVMDESGKFVIKKHIVKPHMFWMDGALHLSAEEGDGLADYWELFIHPDIEEWAVANGYYWDWKDAGSLVLGEL